MGVDLIRAGGGWPASIMIAGGLLLLAACGGDRADETTFDGTGQTEAEVAAEDIPTIVIPTRWATGNANDLRALARSADVIFAGEVTALQGQRFREFSPPSASTPADTGAVASQSRGALFPISLYELRVERSLAGELSRGSTVVIQQAGGISTRPDGSEVSIVLDGDEPLEVGRRYLFFASLSPDGTLSAAPFARLGIGAGGALEPLRSWQHLGALEQLSALRLDNAEREIDAARTH